MTKLWKKNQLHVNQGLEGLKSFQKQKKIEIKTFQNKKLFENTNFLKIKKIKKQKAVKIESFQKWKIYKKSFNTCFAPRANKKLPTFKSTQEGKLGDPTMLL